MRSDAEIARFLETLGLLDRKQALVGIGLYTPSEAAKLTGIGAAKLRRWLRGHDVSGKHYEALWTPQVTLNDEIVLGFRDLTEARVVARLISAGLSSQKMRRAIVIAQEMTGIERPLSTSRFRTDGRSVFLQLEREDGDDELINLFTKQLQFKKIVEPSLKDLHYDHSGIPVSWEPMRGILVDPERSFGQPIEIESGVPTEVLAEAVEVEGSIENAASAFLVSKKSIVRALEFEEKLAA